MAQFSGPALVRTHGSINQYHWQAETLRAWENTNTEAQCPNPMSVHLKYTHSTLCRTLYSRWSWEKTQYVSVMWWTTKKQKWSDIFYKTFEFFSSSKMAPSKNICNDFRKNISVYEIIWNHCSPKVTLWCSSPSGELVNRVHALRRERGDFRRVRRHLRDGTVAALPHSPNLLIPSGLI